MRVMVALLASGFICAAAFVLLAAGLSKLAATAQKPFGLLGRPLGRRWQRAVGLGEITLAAAAVLIPPRAAAASLAAAFGVFAAEHAHAWRAGAEGCDCLGARGSTSPPRAFCLTAAPAAAAAALAFRPPPARGADVAALALGMAGAAVWTLLFARPRPARATAAPARLVETSAFFLERRLSRRTALQRLALAGSAFCIAPLRYLLYPVSALAVIVPDQCGGGLCTDGYTAFCCELAGGVNACPAGTFAGGWWMCTDYPGRRLCAEQGVRYYLDCNRLPGHAFPGGCHCAHGTCSRRRVACNVFRYGQCNTHIAGVTEVVCRVVMCENPSRVPSLHCGSSLAVDDAVCRHDAPCLEPAIPLSGASGV
jgi:hypothetical protein